MENYIAPEVCDASSVFSLNMKSLLMYEMYEGKWEVHAVFGTLILYVVHVCLTEATEVASWFMDK
jgi:hypothetical protein